MLVEDTLFGTKDKVQIAMERLRAFEPNEGYYVAFSGGKDSQVIYHLCKEAGVKMDAHYSLTTVDPPEFYPPTISRCSVQLSRNLYVEVN